MGSETKDTLKIVTCSVARDIDLFALLAKSIDRHVDEEVMHDVLVPGEELQAFQKFSSDRRRIIAQEDLLPTRLFRIPPFVLKLLGKASKSRSPVYITPKLQVVRGWMLQQYLKIESTRRASEKAVMHVDSDVYFVRPFRAAMAFEAGCTRFFKTDGETENPMHELWIETAELMLGGAENIPHNEHYVENCVLWDRDVVSAMVAQIESHYRRSLEDVIFALKTMSEYYLYGVFANQPSRNRTLANIDIPFCNSFWSEDTSRKVTPEDFNRPMADHTCAIAIQSTHKITIVDRMKIYRILEEQAA